MVTKGWTKAVSRLDGAWKWQFFVHPKIAYGEIGQGRTIGPNATLIFEVDLLGIKAPAQEKTSNQPITSDIIKVPSAEELKKGAKIEVIKPDQLPKTEGGTKK